MCTQLLYTIIIMSAPKCTLSQNGFMHSFSTRCSKGLIGVQYAELKLVQPNLDFYSVLQYGVQSPSQIARCCFGD